MECYGALQNKKKVISVLVGKALQGMFSEKKGTKECLVCCLLCKKGAKVRIYVYSYLLIFIETLDEYTSNYKRDYCLGD